MNYILGFFRPGEQLISVEIQAVGSASPVQFFLPKWRPGRYEQQRFDRNISDVNAFQVNGIPLVVERLSTHHWQVDAPAGKAFTLSYNYYANALNAGSSYFDKSLVYINGVNLLMYQKEHLDEKCELTLKLPEAYQVACGLPKVENVLLATDFHQLVDAPILASPDLKHHQFQVAGIETHFWFAGDCQPDIQKLELDVSRYTRAQMEVFGTFPASDYHYLFLIRPDYYRHGVEHYNSTVVAMGPGYKLMEPKMYRSFLEICSHELFHAWNVKAIRPTALLPYDYDREVHTHLHYVTEGVTTYYGDLMLWKGNIWQMPEWLESLNNELSRFYRRGGKDFVSLSEASFDSWVNGYFTNGTPNRRISFYTKGYLITFLMDVEIRRATQNARSFDDVMFVLYENFGKKGKGYTREDFKGIVEQISGRDFDDFFARYIEGTHELEPALQAAGAYMGLEIERSVFASSALTFYGLEVGKDEKGAAIVENVYPESPALLSGLSKGDEIISVNQQKVNGNFDQLLAYYGQDKPIEVHFFHQNKLAVGTLRSNPDHFRYIPQFVEVRNPTSRQLENQKAWKEIRKVKEMVRS